MKAEFSFEGSCNTEIFKQYVEKVLCPELESGQIVIIDNASFHKSLENKSPRRKQRGISGLLPNSSQATGNSPTQIKELIEVAGCELIYLPPYSPELNPIEKYWAMMKRKFKLLVKNGLGFIEAIYERLKLTKNFVHV